MLKYGLGEIWAWSFNLRVQGEPREPSDQLSVSSQENGQALTGWLGWLKHHPVCQNVAGLISSWGAHGRQPN